MSTTQERIRRLLLVVPWAARHREGVPAEAFAARLGIPPDHIERELDLLMLVGKPPFSPADYLDVYLEGDRVHVALAQRLVRPPRFTHDEALALAVGGQALLAGDTGEWGDALRGVLAKLEDAMIPAERERYRRLKDRIVLGGGAPAAADVHEVVRQAVSQRIPLHMVYYSAWRDALGERTVHPYGLLAHRGYWYLVAGPDGEDGHKMFRLDRIREARPAGEPGAYEVPEGLKLERLSPDGFLQRAGEPAVRVRMQPDRARWFADRFSEAREAARTDQAVDFELPGAAWGWLVAWVLAQGGAARVISPPELVRQVREAGRRILARHARGASSG